MRASDGQPLQHFLDMRIPVFPGMGACRLVVEVVDAQRFQMRMEIAVGLHTGVVPAAGDKQMRIRLLLFSDLGSDVEQIRLFGGAVFLGTAEIEQELQEIENRIAIYRRELGL